METFLQLCGLYEIAPERLVAEISRIVEDRPPVIIDQEQIERLASTEALLVADFVHEVRAMRVTPSGNTITLRTGDLEVLASASGHRTEELLDTIGHAMRRS